MKRLSMISGLIAFVMILPLGANGGGLSTGNFRQKRDQVMKKKGYDPVAEAAQKEQEASYSSGGYGNTSYTDTSYVEPSGSGDSGNTAPQTGASQVYQAPLLPATATFGFKPVAPVKETTFRAPAAVSPVRSDSAAPAPIQMKLNSSTPTITQPENLIR